MQVIVDNLLISYEKQGKGKSVLFLHGWASNTQAFKHLQNSLANDYEVLAVNLPGFGGSQNPTIAWDLDDYSAFVLSFLSKIEARNLYAVIGHSNGGSIAIRALASNFIYPQKMILLASAGIRGDQASRQKALRYLTKIGKFASKPLPSSIKSKLRTSLYAKVGSDMLTAEHMQETFKKIISEDVQSDAAKISVPTLLIYGEEDQDTPVSYGEKFHELMSDSTLEILPHAGHFVHLDRQDEVEHAIKEFLK